MTDLSVGLTLSIALGAPATYDQAGYEALTYTVVGDVGSVPEFGGEAQVAEWIPVATGVVDKGVGSINYGSYVATFRKSLTDAGQIALAAGFDGANRGETYSVKLAHPSFGAIYVTAVITGYKYNFNDANSWYMGSATFEIKTKPVTVDDVYTLTFLAVGNGTIVGQAVQYIVTGSDATTVYAAHNPTKTFTTWSDAVTTNPRTITNVTASATLTATFSA